MLARTWKKKTLGVLKCLFNFYGCTFNCGRQWKTMWVFYSHCLYLGGQGHRTWLNFSSLEHGKTAWEGLEKSCYWNVLSWCQSLWFCVSCVHILHRVPQLCTLWQGNRAVVHPVCIIAGERTGSWDLCAYCWAKLIWSVRGSHVTMAALLQSNFAVLELELWSIWCRWHLKSLHQMSGYSKNPSGQQAHMVVDILLQFLLYFKDSSWL